MSADWRQAFLVQARSDYELFRQLRQISGVENCHRLHYLQMATEKLAKAYLKDPATPPDLSHRGFVRFLGLAKLSNHVLNACKLKSQKQFNSYLKSLRPVAQKVEELAPSGNLKRPNPEYPWESKEPSSEETGKTQTVIRAPAEYGFPDLDLNDPKAINMLRFVEACLSVPQI